MEMLKNYAVSTLGLAGTTVGIILCAACWVIIVSFVYISLQMMLMA